MTQLTSNGIPLDTSPDAFGELRDSNDLLDDTSALKERMAEDGYLLLRDYLDLEWVMDARRSVLEVLSEHEMVDENHSLMEARAAKSDNGKFRSAIGSHAALGKLPAVRKLVHSGRMVDFYTAFLGGEVRSFDFIWMRVMGPGRSSAPHYDIVYMGRGTTNLYTSWTPLGDAPLSDASLMVLENSHRLEELKATYGQMDVDKKGNWKKTGGSYGKDPAAIQKEHGCRWLTTDFRAGDLLVFSMYTMHCSLDNRSDRRFGYLPTRATNWHQSRWMSVGSVTIRSPIPCGNKGGLSEMLLYTTINNFTNQVGGHHYDYTKLA